MHLLVRCGEEMTELWVLFGVVTFFSLMITRAKGELEDLLDMNQSQLAQVFCRRFLAQRDYINEVDFRG